MAYIREYPTRADFKQTREVLNKSTFFLSVTFKIWPCLNLSSWRSAFLSQNETSWTFVSNIFFVTTIKKKLPCFDRKQTPSTNNLVVETFKPTINNTPSKVLSRLASNFAKPKLCKSFSSLRLTALLASLSSGEERWKEDGSFRRLVLFLSV